MPRLTNHHYLQIRAEIVQLWETDMGAFGYLSFQEQRYLHDYFKPASRMSNPDAVAHRAVVSKEQPVLPQQAGRARKKLEVIVAGRPHVQLEPAAMHPGKRRVVVQGIRRPQVDVEALARALLEIAKDEARRDYDDEHRHAS